MTEQPFRFLHAADFQLDQPLHGLTDIPDPLRGILIDSVYRAAERVIDTAISEQVAFVCLGGDLLNLALPTARSMSFLREQFERLDQSQIPVYWSLDGTHQEQRWPSLLPLPDSVHRFQRPSVERFTHEGTAGLWSTCWDKRGGGDSSIAEFCAHAERRYSVAVASGEADSRLMATRSIEYWALGGHLIARRCFTEPSVAHYPGTPQGRHPGQHWPAWVHGRRSTSYARYASTFCPV